MIETEDESQLKKKIKTDDEKKDAKENNENGEKKEGDQEMNEEAKTSDNIAKVYCYSYRIWFIILIGERKGEY